MIIITNISSGNLIPYILQFKILDVYGKIVNLDEGFIIYFSLIFKNDNFLK